MQKETLLGDIFKRYFGANYFIDDFEVLKRELNHPKFPNRAIEFKRELASAIANHLITPKILEDLTDIDYEAQEEVDEFLKTEIWQSLYGDEPIEA